MDKLEKATYYFENGYSCAQSVLAAFGEEYGLRKELAFKLAKNFGAGCMFRGEMCGAISGALMIYGLKYGSDNPDDDFSEEVVFRLSSDHIKEFEKLYGTVLCKDLLGKHVGIPDQLNSAIEQNLFKLKCPGFVKDSAFILKNQIENTDKKLNQNNLN